MMWRICQLRNDFFDSTTRGAYMTLDDCRCKGAEEAATTCLPTRWFLRSSLAVQIICFFRSVFFFYFLAVSWMPH